MRQELEFKVGNIQHSSKKSEVYNALMWVKEDKASDRVSEVQNNCYRALRVGEQLCSYMVGVDATYDKCTYIGDIDSS